ncbi:unnamed protein product [Moneuplotes crassus]|uniref:Exocyst complex component Sec6 n=1 Tax=Euplotes crassus TaxID=5936 RepID=A0AAD2D9U0_EUPCR|nr:unnamed protein product [Moneuplotes crassus]
MKEPDELPKFYDSNSALKQAKSDFRQLLKHYNIMQEGAQSTGDTDIRYLKEQAKAKKDSTKRELMTLMKQNLAKLEKGHARVRQAKAQNKRIKECYLQIAETFKNSFTPLQEYSAVINQAFTMKNNISQLNKSLKQFVNLGEEVSMLVADLDDPQKIIDVYKKLVILINLRRSLIAKFKESDTLDEGDNPIKLKKLEKEFTGIKILEEKFFEKMHGFMENHQFIIQKQPAYFIKIMRIIECDNKISQMKITSKPFQTIQEEVEGIEETKEPTSTGAQEENHSFGLKESCTKEISKTVQKQAKDAYEKAFTVESIIDISERLIKSLNNVEKDLGHVFPPSYNISHIYFYAYKEVILEKINPYISNMEKIIENGDKSLLLLLVAFVDTSEQILTKLDIKDEALISIKAQLSRFIPTFLDHIEHLLEDLLLGIRKQFYSEYDKLISVRESNIGMARRSEIDRLWTNMPDDIFTFIQKQFDIVAERLSGSHLFEVLKSSLSRVGWLMNNLSEKAEKIIFDVAMNGPSKESKGFEGFMIYINDFNEIINIFEDFFQEYVIAKISESEKEEEKRAIAKERVQNILTTTYRDILKARNDMTAKLPRYVLIHDLEREDFIYLFTKRWENNKGEDTISNVLATIMEYITEIDACFKEGGNKNLLKTVTGQFLSKIISEAYFLKLLISINKRNNLKIQLPDDEYIASLLPFTFAESQLKPKSSNRIIKDGNDYFHSVTMLIEGIQQDKDTFQSFRERNTSSVGSSVYSTILTQFSSVVLILSMIYNSTTDIEEIMHLLPDYIQSFKKIPYSKELLIAMINIDPSKISSKVIAKQFEEILNKFDTLNGAN